MILVIQRVKEAQIMINHGESRKIGMGLVCFFGVEKDDLESDVAPLILKAAQLRCFGGGENSSRMDQSVMDISGEILFVSQFTLCASLNKGNRPDFGPAESPGRAKKIYDFATQELTRQGIPHITGQFGAHMDISLINTGPVTFVLRRRHGKFATE